MTRDRRRPITVQLTVRLDAAAMCCDNCGSESYVFHAVPVDLRGQYVEPDYRGDWRAAPCCKRCAEAYNVAGVMGLELILRVLTEPVRMANNRVLASAS